MKNLILHNLSNSKNNFSTPNFLSLMKTLIALFVISVALLFAGNLNAQTDGISRLQTVTQLKADNANQELVFEDKEVKVFLKTDADQNKQYIAVNQFGDNVNIKFDENSVTNTPATTAKKAGSNQTPPTNPRPPIKCKCVKKNPQNGLCTEYECTAGTVKF